MTALVADSFLIARRNLAHIRQIPEKLLDVTLQPLMFVLLFAFVFGGVIAVPGGNYRQYLIGGILVQTIAFGMIGPGTSLATDLREGIVDRFRTLPISRSAFLLGHMIAELAGMVLAITILSLSGLLVGWRIDSDPLHAVAGYAIMRDFRPRDGLDRAARRRLGALAGRRDGRRVHGRVPAHVRREHVRAARRAAGGTARSSPSGTRSARWPPPPAPSSGTRPRSRTTRPGRWSIPCSTASPGRSRSCSSACR